MAALVLTAAASAFAGSIGASAFTTALITGAAAAGGAFLNSMVVGALTPTQRQKVDAGGISDLRIQTSRRARRSRKAMGADLPLMRRQTA